MSNGKLIVREETETRPEPYEHEGLAVSLARAEVDQQITTARAYPRSISRVTDHILTLATLDDKTANKCIYAFRRDGKLIKGPSIRLAEIVASQWGNCRVGARVVHVDRFEKFVEAEGVFHDLETNMATTARTRRRISTKDSHLFSEDMIIVTGNAACAIAKRNAILAAVPQGVWSRGYEAVEDVIAGDAKTLVARRRVVFATLAAEYKITAQQIFDALAIGGEDDIDLERLAMLTAMRSSLKNGEATIEELFPKPQPNNGAPKDLKSKLDALATEDGPMSAIGPDTTDVITDEIAAAAQAKTAAQNAVSDATDRIHAAIEAQASATARILDDARMQTKKGALQFKYWYGHLNQRFADQLAPYLDQLRAEANAADKAKESA